MGRAPMGADDGTDPVPDFSYLCQQLVVMKDKLLQQCQQERQELQAEIAQLKAALGHQQSNGHGRPNTTGGVLQRAGSQPSSMVSPAVSEPWASMFHSDNPPLKDQRPNGTRMRTKEQENSPAMMELPGMLMTERPSEGEGAGSHRGSRSLRSHSRSKVSTYSEDLEPAVRNDMRFATSEMKDISTLRNAAMEREARWEKNRDVKQSEQKGLRGATGMMLRRISSVSSGMARESWAQDSKLQCVRNVAERVVSTPLFDSFIGCVILAHSVLIGVQTSHSTTYGTTPEWLGLFDTIFLCIYCAELGLRLFVYGWKALRSHWVKFDAALVFVGLLEVLIALIPFVEGDGLSDLMLIRILRISRLARTARLMIQFRTLWMLVQGLMHSILTLIWTLLIMGVLCYIFAILGMEMFANPEEGKFGDLYEEVANAHFGTLTDAMITMFQFLTLDSIGNIHRPIIRARPIASLYFVSFVLLVPIALMNLVTAIMVESSLQQANQDQEAARAWEAQTRKSLLPKLTRIFRELDADGSGEVDIDELQDTSTEIKDQMKAICNGGDIEDIFAQLDYDGSGSLSIDEFCEGLLKAGSDKPVELYCIMRQCSDVVAHVRKIGQMLEKTQENPHPPMPRLRSKRELRALATAEEEPQMPQPPATSPKSTLPKVA